MRYERWENCAPKGNGNQQIWQQSKFVLFPETGTRPVHPYYVHQTPRLVDILAVLAAWFPDVVFALVGAYLILKVPT